MKRFLLSIFIMIFLFSAQAFASRNSDDIVTATNSAFNNYIQDVIGNKNDTTNGASLIGTSKVIKAKANTNIAKNVAIKEVIDTNQNRIDIIDTVVDTNQNRIDIIDVVVDTNLRTSRTNRNRIDIIDVAVDTNLRTSRTNRNRIDIIDQNTDTNVARGLVPTQNSANNVSIRDVIGNKTDTHDGDSIYAFVETALDHVHNQARVYPTQAAGVTVAAAGAAWTLTNNFTNQVVPASTITSDFDIHYISIENLSANAVYELVLYNMTDGIEIGRCRFTKNAAQDGTMNVPMQTPIQDGNDKIGARLASSTAVEDTVTFSIFYHIY